MLLYKQITTCTNFHIRLKSVDGTYSVLISAIKCLCQTQTLGISECMNDQAAGGLLNLDQHLRVGIITLASPQATNICVLDTSFQIPTYLCFSFFFTVTWPLLSWLRNLIFIFFSRVVFCFCAYELLALLAPCLALH